MTELTGKAASPMDAGNEDAAQEARLSAAAPGRLYVKTAAGWSEVGVTVGPIRLSGGDRIDQDHIRMMATATTTLTISPLSRAALRWWRRQRKWAHNSRTYRKPVAVKPALRGRRHA